MAFTLQDLMSQFGSFGGGTQGDWNGVSQTGMTYPTPQNTSMDALGGVGGMAAFAANPALGAGLMGLQALSGLFQGNKQYKLAKDQFKFQKQIANANLNNSIKSYNNSLEDRLNSRGFTEGRDAAAVQEEIDRKRLSR